MGWQTLLALLGTALGLVSAGHALLFKRRPQAAFGWIAVCLMIPFAGALLYWLFGINRVRSRARKLRPPSAAVAPEAVATVPEELAGLARLGQAVSGMALVGGNRIEPLHDGEQAYPAMLAAIDGATRRVYLSTYIFDNDDVGQRFAVALAEAVARGVEVRVLVDGIGELYSFPPIHRRLRALGVPYALFLPPRLVPPSVHLNLRNHRKLLSVDGRIGFVGGMNIGERHLAASGAKHAVVDVHFRCSGPIVTQIESIFVQDWQFATGEVLPMRPCTTTCQGGAACRAIADGPAESLNRLAQLLTGAIGTARRRVLIMTPYFLPPREVLGTLQAAALRGVDVVVVLPEKNNLPYVHRATRHMLWELLKFGIRVYYQPPPFAHGKLLVIDGVYCLVGSANIDDRSLRLNFELDVEVYDSELARVLEHHFESVRTRSTAIGLTDVDGRPLPAKLVDGIAWLFSPYL